jgi:hypothetical protein
MEINKVVIWGHELHDHTHSYIHNGFYRAFKQLGYDTYMFNNDLDNINKLDFNNTLFISHGIVINNIPLNETSIYVLHNVELVTNNNKLIPKGHRLYSDNLENNIHGIQKKNIINLQVYSIDCVNRDIKDEKHKCHYYLEPPHNTIYFPWASDLLPAEIDINIENLDNIISKNEVNFIGMGTEPWTKLCNICKEKNIQYNKYGGTFNKSSNSNKSVTENIQLIQQSIIAPALQHSWQVEHEYIPCRIFKNISYGKMGITNNKAVNELFDNKLIYSENIEELVDKGIEFKQNKDKNNIITELMIEVRNKHTYINRVKYILNYIEKYLNIYI